MSSAHVDTAELLCVSLANLLIHSLTYPLIHSLPRVCLIYQVVMVRRKDEGEILLNEREEFRNKMEEVEAQIYKGCSTKKCP